MSAIRQHIEKKHAFTSQDFKSRFVIQSIGMRFSRGDPKEARLQFQQFVNMIHA